MTHPGQKPPRTPRPSTRDGRAAPLALRQWFTRPVQLLTVLCLLLAGALHSPLVAASEDANEQRAQSLTRSVMSPFCPGRTLDGCPSPKAAEWRADIRTWVSEGASNDEIRRRLQSRAPKDDLSGGPNTGVGLWLPVTAALLTLALLVFVLRRLSRSNKAQPSTSEPGPAAPPDDAALDARLDAELRQDD